MVQQKKSAAGAINVQRRTWDEAHFAKKAQERALGEEIDPAELLKQQKRVVDGTPPPDAELVPGTKRAFLQKRELDIDLEENLNKRRVSAITFAISLHLNFLGARFRL